MTTISTLKFRKTIREDKQGFWIKLINLKTYPYRGTFHNHRIKKSEWLVNFWIWIKYFSISFSRGENVYKKGRSLIVC